MGASELPSGTRWSRTKPLDRRARSHVGWSRFNGFYMKTIASPLATAWNWFTKNAYFLAAAPALIIALYLALMDRVAAGSLAAGIFVVLLLLQNLPHMELLKAWGIEAKMRERLKEADEITKNLRQAAIASARLTFYTLGPGSRMGGSNRRERQALADIAEQMLRDVDVKDDEIREIKRPLTSRLLKNPMADGVVRI
jgi:hypothetical protein